MANAQVIKDVHVLEILLVLCAIPVGQIGMEKTVVCFLGHASIATAKVGVFQILRNVSVKNNLLVQLARYAPQTFSAPIVPDTVILFRPVMVKECATQMDFAL